MAVLNEKVLPLLIQIKSTGAISIEIKDIRQGQTTQIAKVISNKQKALKYFHTTDDSVIWGLHVLEMFLPSKR